MKFFKNPFVAIISCILIVVLSSIISINVKLGNECEKVIDSFYVGKLHNGTISTSIYGDIVNMYELAENVVVVADNYGIDTRKLVSDIAELKDELNFKKPDSGEIYSEFTEFYSNLWAVTLELSNTQLSQRHLEYMSSASQEINSLKSSIESSDYNNNVRVFYKKFDRFPANLFAEIFDIDYPEYFA